MRRQGKLYDKLVSEDNLRQALLEVNLTHRWYPRHRPNPTVVWVEQDVDARVRALREIIDGMIAGAICCGSAARWRGTTRPGGRATSARQGYCPGWGSCGTATGCAYWSGSTARVRSGI